MMESEDGSFLVGVLGEILQADFDSLVLVIFVYYFLNYHINKFSIYGWLCTFIIGLLHL